jgi:muramidase (phage lysozyme)
MPNYTVGLVDTGKFNFYRDRLETDNALLGEPRVQALMATIRGMEGQEYNKIVGGRTFIDYSQRPNTKVGDSTAAGAYQFTHPTWTDQQKALDLPDFAPPSQDLAAVDLLRRLHATDRLLSDDIDRAVFNAGQRWQALPTTTDEEIDSEGRRRGINHPAKGKRALTNTLDQIKADYLKNLR